MNTKRIITAVDHCLILRTCKGCPMYGEKNCQLRLHTEIKEKLEKLDTLEKDSQPLLPGFEIYDREQQRMLTETEAKKYISEHPEIMELTYG